MKNTIDRSIAIIPQAGDRISLDTWPSYCFYAIFEDTLGYKDSSFPGCQFRYTPDDAPGYQIAINIRVTGSAHILFNGAKDTDGKRRYKARVRIEFVGDGEPSTFAAGILYFNR